MTHVYVPNTNERSDDRTHTPGPWVPIKGIDDDTERWGVYTAGPQNNYHIATIENGAPGDTLETETYNAHLISAAPDLLAACKRAKELLVSEVTKEPDRTIFWELVSAIRKAEGQP